MTTNLLTSTEFAQILSDFAGRRIIHQSVTRTISNMTGDRTLTYGVPTYYSAYLQRVSQKWDWAKAGFLEQGDTVMQIAASVNAKKDDLVYSEYSVVALTAIDGNTTTISITAASHGLSVGDTIIIIGTTNYNGKYVVATAPTSSTFTISDTSHNYASETSGSVIKDFKEYLIKEALDVAGVLDNTSSGTSNTFTSCALAINDAY